MITLVVFAPSTVQGTPPAPFNTFAAISDLKAYASARGYDISAASGSGLVSALIVAMDYLKYKNVSLPWQNCLQYLPQDIIDAQCYLACQACNGIALFTDQQSAFVTQRSIGPSAGIVTLYSATQMAPQPYFPYVETLIAPYRGGPGPMFSQRG